MLPRFFSLIGSDRFLTSTEVEEATEPHPLVAPTWEIYRDYFQGFTGAALDPQFHRLTHTAASRGTVRLEPDTGVVVVGTGPSLAANIDGLRRLTGLVRIVTSPRGAEALAAHGIVPDLVLIEHATALDAHHTARHARDGRKGVLSECPVIAAEWGTPARLLRGIPANALFVPAPSPTWGLWPATAVAMAIDAGASRVALLGVDLGTPVRLEPAHAPLAALLGVLTRLSPIVALDCGSGAPKRGWVKASIGEAAGCEVEGPVERSLHAAPSIQERIADARLAMEQLAPIVGRARVLLTRAAESRAAAIPDARSLQNACMEVLAWREELALRVLLQESLGVSFLPRLWRIGVDLALGGQLWRPLMLAMHELVGQADALAAAIAEAGDDTPSAAGHDQECPATDGRRGEAA